jgi:hypothetical protein
MQMFWEGGRSYRRNPSELSLGRGARILDDRIAGGGVGRTHQGIISFGVGGGGDRLRIECLGEFECIFDIGFRVCIRVLGDVFGGKTRIQKISGQCPFNKTRFTLAHEKLIHCRLIFGNMVHVLDIYTEPDPRIRILTVLYGSSPDLDRAQFSAIISKYNFLIQHITEIFLSSLNKLPVANRNKIC